MRTTDSIIADLQARAEGGEDVRQKIIAHETLARLRAERAEHPKDAAKVAGLDDQIRYWLTLVDEDVDEKVVAQPSKDSVKGVEGLAPDPKS